MTTGGWVMLIISAGGMTAFLAWCIYKVLTTPGSEEHLHTQADIRPKDTEQRE